MTNPAGVLVRACQLRKDYGRGEALVRAVDEVDLEVANGDALIGRGAALERGCRPPGGGEGGEPLDGQLARITGELSLTDFTR